MPTQKDETKILLDADVVIHFVKAGMHLQLPIIFPGRLIMLDKVKTELMAMKSARATIEKFIGWGKIEVIIMPGDQQTLGEYARLIKTRGPGEAACMAVARFHHKYIASSNLKDIQTYCVEHKIKYYTTMDILEEALSLGVFTHGQCDDFIAEVLSKNSKLPYRSMVEFLESRKTVTKTQIR